MARWRRDSEVEVRSFESEQDAERRLHWLTMGSNPPCDPPNPQAEAQFKVVVGELSRLRDLGLSPSEIVPELERFLKAIGALGGIRLADRLDRQREKS